MIMHWVKKDGLESIILLRKMLEGDCGGGVWKSSHWPLGNPIAMVGYHTFEEPHLAFSLRN